MDLQASSPVGLALLDREQRLSQVNQTFAELAGVGADECKGRQLSEVAPWLTQKIEPLVRRIAAGTEALVEEELTLRPAPDRERSRWLLRVYRIDAPPQSYVGVVAIELIGHGPGELDHAAVTRLEAALQELPIGVLVAEASSGKLVAANARAEKVLDRRVTGAEVTAFPELPLARALSEGSVVPEEERAISRDGHLRRIRCAAAAVRDHEDRVIAAVGTLYDITARREEEQVLRDSEKLRLLVEDVRDYAVFMLDAQGRVASWSRGAQRITGYSAEEVVGRTQAVFYTEEDLLTGRGEQSLRVAAESGHYEEEGWRLRKDGSRFYANASYTALRFADGQLRGFSKIVRDVTENKVIEEELRASTSRMVATLESISDGYCALDRDWRFTFVNREAERLLGRSRADLIGICILDAFPRMRGRELHRRLEQAMAAGHKVDVEDFDAVGCWLEIRAYPSTVGLSIYFRDVTERRRERIARQLLAESGKRMAESLEYESSLEHMASLPVPLFADCCTAIAVEEGRPDQAAFIHVDLPMQELGRRMLEQYPIRRDAPRGIGYVIRTGHSERIDVDEAFLASLARSDEHLEAMRSFRISSALIVPLRARGRILGAMVFGVGAPERRYSVEDLRLAEEIGLRAALALDNARLYRDAHAAVRAREDMVAIATHDLKSPITALRLGAQRLLEKARVQAPGARTAEQEAELIAALRRIERQSHKLAELVTFFLEVSKIASGQLDLQLSEVDLGELAREVVARFGEQLADSGSILALEVGAEVVARVDRLRLDQVMSNLLSNAIKWGQSKPIEMTVTSDAQALTVRVRDHGVGIDCEQQRSIFERFRRAMGERDSGGTGLGLYIVKRIVSALGGSIAVDSEPGKGATFTVVLPRGGPR
jgi:PAS domain S-box-containing protein